jgi:hypothetical protein
MAFALRAALVLCVGILAVDCATHAPGTPNWNDAAVDASASTMVTAQELARLGREGSLMDALKRLRPVMLAGRGAAPWVSVDGSPPAELALLRTIQTAEVRDVRLQRASSGARPPVATPDGSLITADVIVVRTWPGGRGSR